MNSNSHSGNVITGGDLRPIRRWLQIDVCVLICLSGIVFAAAEGNPLALLNVPIALIGLLYIDLRDARGLPAVWANVLGFVAFLLAAYEFFGESVEGRLLAFGHLLCYLAWVLLLQRKDNPQFWWLLALSVLQMATSSVLTNSLWFPISAILYMMLALWTLSVFSLDRAVSHAAGVERIARPGIGGPKGDGEGRAAASRSRSNVRLESESRWFTSRFVVGVVVNGVLSLLLGLAIFLLTPRVWAGQLSLFGDSSTAATTPLTGFAEEVSLGEMGEILENPDLVLEVEFYDGQTGRKLDVETTTTALGYDAPTFRGRVLGHYLKGRWSNHATVDPYPQSTLSRKFPLLRQEFRLQPIGTRTLFAADVALAARAAEQVAIHHELFTNAFSVEETEESQQFLRSVFQYNAHSPLSGDPVPWKPASRRIWDGPDKYEQEMKHLPSNVNRLKDLAHSIVGSDQSRTLTPREQAGLIVNYLRDSGEYSYSLSAAVDDAKIDPVEDFLFNRKQGHCEYFASSLALMLRAVGIPSRLVSGFKGGDLNQSTGRFEVRQLHAHAWVEALVDGDWIVLDATPASREDSVANIRTSRSLYERTQRYLQSIWSQGLAIDQSQQKTEIYEPLGDLFDGGLESIRRVGLLKTVLDWFRQLSANPEDWISVPGFVTAFVLLALAAGLVWISRRVWRMMSGWSFGRNRKQRQERQVVAFYERFRALVARRGHVRSDAATQREFASQIEQDWQRRADVDGLAGLPMRLTDAFYRVRFGNEALSETELQSLDAALSQLETWATSRPTA